MKKLFSYPWISFLAAWLVTFVAVMFPVIAEWPIIPIAFLGIALAWTKDGFDVVKYGSVIVGALASQIIFWIG